MKKTTIDSNSKKWLILSLLSLAFAGLQTLIIVISRMPVLKDHFIFKDFFNKALVVHVDLSILFWFLTIGILLNVRFFKINALLNGFALKVAYLALALFISSPFIESDAILSNYVPVIDNFVFFAALGLFFAVVLMISGYALIARFKGMAGLQCYNLAIVIAFFVFVLTSKVLTIETAEFYEMIFWGFGHILQYAYVILMVVAWFVISDIKIDKRSEPYFFFYVAIALCAVFIFINPELSTLNYKRFFTLHMAFGSSVLPLIFIPFIIYRKFNARNEILRNCLISSIILFLYGGFLALLIDESNTIIPAHYHGSTVAVTLALIGLTYYLLDVKKSKIAFYQPFIYCAGQVIHITGLAISGGYGALRKSPDSILNMSAKFWMGIMGIGGLITMIAGVIFLIICYKSLTLKDKKNG
jgi:cytochrome c oxidase subunit 1